MKFARGRMGIGGNGRSKSVVGTGVRRGALFGAAGMASISVLLLSGCTSSSSSSPAPAAKDAASVTPVLHEQMVIQTGKMDGKPGWPKFVPSDLSFPAGATVDLQIVNYDDGTAPVPAASPYGHVWGSDPTFGVVDGGTETVGGKVITSIPNNQVSHTLTIPGLLINIPIPPVPSGQKTVTVDFTFKVNKAGKYFWQCEAPCGTGSTGMSGAMDMPGYMEGYITVT